MCVCGGGGKTKLKYFDLCDCQQKEANYHTCEKTYDLLPLGELDAQYRLYACDIAQIRNSCGKMENQQPAVDGKELSRGAKTEYLYDPTVGEGEM